eukprot:Seg435.9 transcript_id=Seg435.9/GoldUCD/mRNA.D3Y31 product="Inorganic pyrophosphatase" protein_id=Seg435.9/GoldUCD/D3Y31
MTMLYIRTVSSLLWLSIVRRKSPNFKSFCSRTPALFSTMAYSIQESGSLHTQDYKIYIRGENGPVSSFHDIPLFANKEKNIFNMIVEIPRWSNAKLEINKKERLNPIMQDIKKGKVRFVNNVFPYTGYIWNYGALPQTWEDPNEIDDSTKCKGDNDPIDVCEIGHKVAQRGEIKQVKILGTFALIDEGETDWKILVIDVKDPLADKINDISGIRQHMPGLLEATHEWFKLYKIPAGKPENQFAFNGEAKDKEFATKTILSTHEHWKKLIKTKPTVADDISCDNVSVEDSPFKISLDAANQILAEAAARGEPAEIPPEVATWHFVPQSSAVTNAGKN